MFISDSPSFALLFDARAESCRSCCSSFGTSDGERGQRQDGIGGCRLPSTPAPLCFTYWPIFSATVGSRPFSWVISFLTSTHGSCCALARPRVPEKNERHLIQLVDSRRDAPDLF